MASGVKCPSCGLTLYLTDDSAPEGPRCPNCHTPIAPAQSATTSSGGYTRPCLRCGHVISTTAKRCSVCGFDTDIANHLTYEPSGRPYGDRWKIARLGLTAIYFGTAGFLVCVVLGGLTIIALLLRGHKGLDPVVSTVIFIALALALGCWLSVAVGQILCAGVPAESGARSYAIGAACCYAANIAINIILQTGGPLPLVFVGALMGIMQAILFIRFIETLASYLRDELLEASAQKYLSFTIGVLMTQMAGAFAMGLLVAANTGIFACMVIPLLAAIASILLVGSFVAALVSVLWFIRLIEEARRLLIESP